MPTDACTLQIPHTDHVCAWLMRHAGLKTVDLERARRLSTDAGDLLGLLARLGLVSEIELARAWADLLGAPLLLADAALQVDRFQPGVPHQPRAHVVGVRDLQSAGIDGH